MVDGIKVLPVPFEIAVFPVAAGEGEASPGGDVARDKKLTGDRL